LAHYEAVATEIDTPNVGVPSDASLASIPPPRSILNPVTVEYWDLGLEEAIQYGLSHSRVMIDLGGTVLRAPETLPTTYSPSVVETDPQFGPEAALAAFDANFATTFYAQKNDQMVNNQLVGVNGYYNQDYDVLTMELNKRAATGGLFTLRHIVDYNRDNNVTNLFTGGNFDTIIEGEVRQPLLQGSGVEFNRIAGPGARPGVNNGVLVARIKTDIGLTDFSIGVRDYVSNVENAYWDLYFAYHDLDAKIKARDEALETWRSINALHQANRRGGESDKEAQAREQYFRFEADVQEALVGRELEGTRTNNGSTPGTFRGLPGVQTCERRLRLMMGLPPTDARMIRPSDEPPVSRVTFDWPQLACQALCEREELRRQRWVVKDRELELVASRNFLKPNLDLVGIYRWRGFGEHLLNSDSNGLPPFDNAYQNLTSGQFEEWQVGAEFNMPLGFRQGHATVRNAELRLTQARAYLRDQERQVMNDLSDAVAQVDLAFALVQTNINRAVAARDQLRALRVAYEADKVELFVVLDAQRRYAEALSAYYASRVDYAITVRNVYYEKGSLLEYCDVSLAEGPWAPKAYRDAATRERLRGRSRQIDYTLRTPSIVSLGTAPQPPGSMVMTAENTSSRTEAADSPRLPAAGLPHPAEILDKAPLPPPPSAPVEMRGGDGPPPETPPAVQATGFATPVDLSTLHERFFLRDEE
jgi:outer membrane protein TolC